MGETPTLKPCPFCGGEARLYSGEDDFAVEHNGCDACFDAVFNDAASAIAAWNQRHGRAALRAALEEAQSVLADLTRPPTESTTIGVMYARAIEAELRARRALEES